jgi:hypothetical protein
MALDEQDNPNSKFEVLKLLYETNAEQFRYFLTWRQLMLAGYFATVAALALAWAWATKGNQVLLPVPPLVGGVVSLLFWALEQRNRELIKLTSDVGAKLEEKLGYTGMGNFGVFALSEKRETGKMHHSVVLATFYFGSGVLMILIAIFLLFACVACGCLALSRLN